MLQINCCEINQVNSKCEMNLFEKICKEKSKTEKKNITIELCIFELDSTNNVGLLKQIYHKKDTSFSKQKE